MYIEDMNLERIEGFFIGVKLGPILTYIIVYIISHYKLQI